MIGKEAPNFELEGILKDKVSIYNLSRLRGNWVVLFFYPADFTFVCPTEILGFNQRFEEFKGAGATVLGVSVDNIESHRRWIKELGSLNYPLLSDVAKDAVKRYGVLDSDGKAFRATFLIAPTGTLAYMVVSPMNVGRSVDETLRVLRALQTGRLCPADWKPGEATIEPSLRY